MTEATVKNIYCNLRGRLSAYGDIVRSYFNNSGSTKRKYSANQEASANDQHTTPFVARALDEAMGYAQNRNSPLSCVFVKFKDEYAIPEIHALFKEAFHANNGFHPSNELRRIGKYELGMLIHDRMPSISEKLLEIGECLSLFNDQEYSFSISLAEYKKGDGRWDLIQRTQENKMVFENSKLTTSIALESRVDDASASAEQATAVLQKSFNEHTEFLRKRGPLTAQDYDLVASMNKRDAIA